MIAEEQQDQAALYALELLDADEATAFERAQTADDELKTLVAEFREAAATLAYTDVPVAAPPAKLKERVLARVAAETSDKPAAGKIIAMPSQRGQWFPWTAAAALALLCAALGATTWKLRSTERRQTRHLSEARHQLDDAERREQMMQSSLAEERGSALTRVSYCALEPIPAAQQTKPQTAVLWDAASRRGRLQIQKLSPPGTGKDYQLWTVEAGHKNPVSAGVVKLDANGGAAVDFQPGAGDDPAAAVGAFALSLERAGGAPQNEGPILFLGKLQ